MTIAEIFNQFETEQAEQAEQRKKVRQKIDQKSKNKWNVIFDNKKARGQKSHPASENDNVVQLSDFR